MAEENYFTIFNDLIVSNGSNNKSNKSDIIGLVNYSPSDYKFFPSYFSSYQKPSCVILRKYNIQNESVRLNKYFKIISIKEEKDSDKSRNYYRKLIIELEDALGSKKEFSFDEKPNLDITNLDLQRMIKEIYIKLELEKSFEMMEIKESLVAERKVFKDQQKKIQKLEQTIIKLQKNKKQSK